MAQQSFSDISSSSFHNDQFDCERALFTDPSSSDSPSISCTQKLTSVNLETNCSNKSDVIIQGSFMKGLERFQREISYEESVYDIYGLKEGSYLNQKYQRLKSDKEVMEKYVMKFQKSKSIKKSLSKLKLSGLSSAVSSKKTNPAISSTRSPPRQDYYTVRNTNTTNKNTKPKIQKQQKSQIPKRSRSKPFLGSKSKSKSKISLTKSKFVEKQKTKSIIPTK